jgi:hypothetical protein
LPSCAAELEVISLTPLELDWHLEEDEADDEYRYDEDAEEETKRRAISTPPRMTKRNSPALRRAVGAAGCARTSGPWRRPDAAGRAAPVASPLSNLPAGIWPVVGPQV